jgi:Flp pilus assembly protein TadB
LRQKFQQNLLSFIDEIILLMMTGKSFRDSFLYLTANPKDFFQFKMRELLIAGSFQDKTRFTKRNEMIQITELVQAIEKNPHKSIDRLRAFRRQLHWVQSFERKSKQATTQIRAQALVLTLLYCGLLGFVMKNSNASTTPIIFPSVFLFLLGLVALYLLSRRTKWKT